MYDCFNEKKIKIQLAHWCMFKQVLLEIQVSIFLTIGLDVDRAKNEITLDRPNQGSLGEAPTELSVSKKSHLKMRRSKLNSPASLRVIN
ncbi:hypothetical protein CWB96_00880 [Pseudoalteromonas citrea]|uniref:Uncharacterized protein n=1 Tax=Pseudoalteromonas citrea TaxID=43655 RepID=A0A5S3XVS4_9GAMM|nr:hypothetical protein CWB97_17210 [Pseudoalteromonas citrea]TMP62628.1 hypothetical protein CWB96_00880 [Pseudoalteromonas citrea]